MKTIELKAAGRQEFRVRRVTRTTKSAGGSEASVVDQDEQNIGGTLWWAQLSDRWVFVFRIFGVIQHQSCAWWIGYGKNCSWNIVLVTHRWFLPFKIEFLDGTMKGTGGRLLLLPYKVGGPSHGGNWQNVQ